MRRRGIVIFPAAVVIAVTTATTSASGSPAAVDYQIELQALTAAPVIGGPLPTPTGGTATVTSLNFYLSVLVRVPTPATTTAKMRFSLGEGLSWGSDVPDPAEGCTATATTGECDVNFSAAGPTTNGGYWDVVAQSTGNYSIEAEVVDLADSDPAPANNRTAITVTVTRGSGSGQGGTPRVAAGAVKLSPAKARAGSTVVAAVRVTKGGSALTPTRVRCSASIGSVKVKGTGRAASGVASCLFKTPRSGKGKTLTGSVSFSAGGSSFSKRFAVKLS